jgi:hypothetical protein
MMGLINEPMDSEQDDALESEPMGQEDQEHGQNDGLMKVTLAERKILYSQPTSDKIVQILQSGKDPVEALAGAAMLVLSVMDQAAKGKIPPDLAPQLRDVLLNDLSELATASGIDVAEGDVEAAKKMMTDSVRIALQKRGGQQQQLQPPQQPMQDQQQAPAGLIAQG